MNTKHWNWIQGFVLIALLPFFAACSSEDDGLLQSEEKQPVQVNITRAATDGNDWAWQNNDQIKMSITPHNGTATEYILTYQNGNWSNTALDEMVLPATVQAWYPSSASYESFSFAHDWNSYVVESPGWDGYTKMQIDGTVNQSSEAEIAKSDWMTAEQTLRESTLNLTLQHKLCKVTVIISNYDDYPIESVRFYTSYTNNSTGAYTGDLRILEVNPLTDTTAHKYTAIISAWTYDDVKARRPPLMKLKVNGKDLFAKHTEPLLSGNAYTFNLTVKNPDATTTRSAGASECELELVDVEDMNK